MKLIQNILNWIGDKFIAWLTKVGEENRPDDYDSFPEADHEISRSDLIGDERGY